MMEKQKNVNLDCKNSLIFVLFIFAQIITMPIVQIMGSTVFFWLFIASLFIYSIYINRRINTKFILICLILSIIFILNAICVPYTVKVLGLYMIFIRYGILGIYFAMMIRDYESLMKYWNHIGVIGFLISNIYLGYYEDTNGYMNLGINLTYSFIGFSMYYYAIKGNCRFISMILMLISFIEITILGNRSSMMICLFILVYYELLSLNKTNILISISKLTIGFMSIIYVLLNLKNILINLIDQMNKIGIYSYSLTKYVLTLQDGLKGIITQSSGRDDIYILAKNIIVNSGFMPHGVGYFEYSTGYIYPHNLFIEVCLDFGIFGVIGLIILFLVLLKKYITYYKQDELFKVCVATMFIYSFTRLMFSDSYWREPLFWMNIGLVIFYQFNNKGVTNDKLNITNTRNKRKRNKKII